jgi:hypothetical protein
MLFLQPESESYNTRIVDVSYRYPNMCVILPQFYIAIITMMRNASLISLKYQNALTRFKSRKIDVTNFENEL